MKTEMRLNMRNRQRKEAIILSAILIWTMLLSSMPLRAQSILETSSIAGGSSVFVFRKASAGAKTTFTKKRRAAVKRTTSQRVITRKKVVMVSRTVAKANRVRRKIKEVTPQEFAKVDLDSIKRKSSKEAAPVFAGLAEYYLEKDEGDKAIEAYEQAISLNPNYKDAKLGLSEVLTRKGDEALSADENARAISFYNLAIANDERNSSAFAGRGQAYDASGDDEKATTDYLKALSLDPKLVQVKAPLGIIYYSEGMERGDETLIAKADQFVSEAVSDSPDVAESQFFLGLIRYRQGRITEAEAALRRSIALDNSNDDTFYYLGAVLNQKGDIEGAIGQFEQALKLDNKNSLAWFELGVGFYNLKSWDRSIQAFDKSIMTNPNNTSELRDAYAEAHANRADAYRQKNDLVSATTNYRVATNLIKDDPEIWSNFGFVLGRQDKWNASIDAFKQAAQLDGNEFTYANLGWAYLNLARYDESFNHPRARIEKNLREALPMFEKALTYNPKFEAALLNLGVVQTELADYKGAEKSFELANSVRKNWIPVQNGLGNVYLKLSKYKEAKNQFRAVLEKESTNVLALFGLAQAEFMLKNRDEARKLQTRLRAIDNKSAERLETIFRKELSKEDQ